MENCKICNQEFKNLKALSAHFNVKHDLTAKEYYDKFLKKEHEGKCIVCDKETTYRNMGVGYLTNCSVECRNKNKNIKRDYWKGKIQPKEMVDKRIENTDQNMKEINRKNSMINKYGVDNPMKLEENKDKVRVKLIGTKRERTDEWQTKIIESKRKNNTLKHSEETKKKVSDSLNKYYSENLDREKYISVSNNVRHFSGWYNNLYFRSSLELSFLVNNEDKTFTSCEKNEYKVIYEKDNKQKSYYPDFTDGFFIYEIKPTSLLEYSDNQTKINRGLEVYGENFKLITEKESPYIKKSKIIELINSGVVVVSKNSFKKLKNYKY